MTATPKTDAAQFERGENQQLIVTADFARELERELTETRCSLRREENARKVLADDNDRLRTDAARYRYIEQFAQCWDAKMDGNHGWVLRSLNTLRGRTFAQAIDAAMEQQS